MIDTAKELIANGCDIQPFSVLAGEPFGHQPGGFKCVGFGIEALGPTPDMAAVKWLSAFKDKNMSNRGD